MRILRPSQRGGPPASSALMAALTRLLLVSLTMADGVPLLNFAAMEPRDVSCPANYFSCEDQGLAFDGICCVTGQVCALDSNNNPACCPSGSVCTGAAPTSTGGGTGGGGTATATTTSYVSNSLYAFPAVATSFSNAGACSSAATRCANNYASCTAALEAAAATSGAYGVTIAITAGGGATSVITAGGATHSALPASSAQSICSSLSSQACHGLSTPLCAATGSSTAGFYVGTAAGNAAGPRVTGAPCLVGVMAGVGLGVWGGAGL